MQSKFQDRGFTVLAFPTNDYKQELGSNEEIRDFLTENHPDLNFPVFGLSELEQNPVYKQLKEQLPDQHVKHNFFKYLVDRNGNAIKMFTKKQDPHTFVAEIEALLNQKNVNGPPKHKLVTH